MHFRGRHSLKVIQVQSSFVFPSLRKVNAALVKSFKQFHKIVFGRVLQYSDSRAEQSSKKLNNMQLPIVRELKKVSLT